MTEAPSSYPPHPEFKKQANVGDEAYRQAERDRLKFWAEQANRLSWATPFEQVLDWSDAPFVKWFVGGRLNVAYNCVDRHVEAGHGDRTAIYWEGEPVGDSRSISYAELQTEVCKAANALSDLGLVAGDRVAIYLPMIPEALIAMLACARLGVMHSVVFAGFTATALRARIADAEAKLLITADGQFRRGKPMPLKEAADEAVGDDSPVKNVLVVRRTGIDVPWTDGRDLWWHEVVDRAPAEHTCEAFDAEHPLFLLYTSGTTGKPKGIVHTSGGYLTQSSYTHHSIFDIKPETDVFWCTADIGWVTGHTYSVYGPLCNGVTQVIYEGTPSTPTQHRHFEIIEKYGVTIYYAAPTLIRTFMRWGREIPDAHDLSSLRLLGSVGEPINPEAWRWYREVIGSGRTPVVDTWWQTETGAAMISPLPGIAAAKPGSAMTALPGISARIVDDDGKQVEPCPDHGEHITGYLVIDQPWPAMLRGIWGDPDRYRENYWTKFAQQGWYFTGDSARYDPDGAIWVEGRVDDVMNVSGHRISTAEVESALVGHSGVAEAAVVGAADETTGQAICAFVVLQADHADSVGEEVLDELRDHVAKEISPIARPREIHVVPELPKTRSGKIMRRLLRDIANDHELGDTSTLLDPGVFDAIRAAK
ncbi:Acetyl-coenzyme A synthetase Acs (acetate--CoA ligase) (acetyl-CoA synthetase) (acetyl-CoA synthase) (acyl-activating enzyme) (acetate thiokinase) (acetyl-activating enzyme) (acetate--coenzyme A ligase) (acetyl-coenzyme A synthase) [Mycobacterium tuberculosis H37Rv] [Mycobacterium shimoidei]|uniref:Acetyl-coenzyme A synthetase n=1 Tax=Mycobacterium shimoidei TaxID=29313 RepID=A0A375YWK6_MYCSH|nr:acetate--CoA ligase [Mycobacterium shimoidei]SRX93207.1 Acetyl-coenzyme A synthetase Acs (acetate--CoA ligase) (acetyl-CoA synthetase) (acetyl-CoA synthase) (acyl-activating enzyme) (acetate thiokinase) (acetyl-activating enzyme) (acetate--coenzyme A ligase) (acetyl-coenzyme A synthase) [Mycobacterium tuberculosis H37Rv] [Mycobacterium shimoidei]